MTPTTKTATSNAPSPIDTEPDPLEITIHEKNRALRERYVALCEMTEDPSADQRRVLRQRENVGAEFITLNSGFAASLVSKSARPQDDREELYQEALVTMWEHFLTWDPDQARFTTYAFYSILGDVGRARVRAHDEGSYGDHHARSQTLHTISELTKKLGRKPSIAELVAETGLTTDTVRRVLRPSRTSTDKMVGHDGSVTTLGELLADSRTPPPANLEDLWNQHLSRALNQLSMQEILIVERRRGLSGWPGETLQQVGQWLGIGREPVRRAEDSAERKCERAGASLPALAE